MSPPMRSFVFPTGRPLSSIFGQHKRMQNQYLSIMSGPKKVVELDMNKPLQEQLTSAPRDADALRLDKDIPTDADWDLLSDHFMSVKDLSMDSGYRERLNDEKIPLHWPLEKLTISSSCGEVCRSPWILEGRVPHLVFNYTCGLRFEGPTMDELFEAHRAAGKVEPRKAGGPITVVYGPALAEAWLRDKHANKDQQNDETVAAAADEDGQKSQLKTLEIIHNDARDTLFRYVLAHPNLIDPAETLNIDASSRNDLLLAPERILEDVFPQLVQLRTLVLVLGDHYDNRAQLSDFFQYLPPNLRVLRFRSSVSLAANEDVVERWVKAFADPAFLPGLERLSFVLDLVDGEEEKMAWEESSRRPGKAVTEAEWEESRKVAVTEEESNVDGATSPCDERTKAEGKGPGEDAGDGTVRPLEGAAPAAPTIRTGPSDESLARAKRACERVHRAAESRGVEVQPFTGEWNTEFAGIKRKPIDERWENL
ncbi:hypothetical protein DFH06DRAFT_1475743 [Mycena polygramma]|nr:hypothetical protein DFH06DRAFT_1475743 [Mycena polygramma]